MSRFLVNLKPPADPLRHYHVGDVVDELPDGHTFTETEMNDPRFLIVDIPGPVGQTNLLDEDRKAGRGAPLLRRRRASLDVVALQDHKDGRKKLDKRAALLGAVVVKPAAQSPDEF